jgi:hypothetical protein
MISFMLRRSAEKLTFFSVRGIASEAYSYGARQFSKLNFLLSYILTKGERITLLIFSKSYYKKIIQVLKEGH